MINHDDDWRYSYLFSYWH